MPNPSEFLREGGDYYVNIRRIYGYFNYLNEFAIHKKYVLSLQSSRTTIHKSITALAGAGREHLPSSCSGKYIISILYDFVNQ